jgi:hypothetical protein
MSMQKAFVAAAPLTAKVEDGVAPEAEAIPSVQTGVDPAERRNAYAAEGWTKFDETLDPYNPDQIDQEHVIASPASDYERGSRLLDLEPRFRQRRFIVGLNLRSELVFPAGSGCSPFLAPATA